MSELRRWSVKLGREDMVTYKGKVFTTTDRDAAEIIAIFGGDGNGGSGTVVEADEDVKSSKRWAVRVKIPGRNEYLFACRSDPTLNLTDLPHWRFATTQRDIAEKMATYWSDGVVVEVDEDRNPIPESKAKRIGYVINSRGKFVGLSPTGIPFFSQNPKLYAFFETLDEAAVISGNYLDAQIDMMEMSEGQGYQPKQEKYSPVKSEVVSQPCRIT